MKAYDAQGNPIDVPEAEAAQRLFSKQAFLPKGAPVPVRLENGTVATVPVESLRQALTQRAQIISPEEHAQAVQQAHYGDTVHALETAGIGAVEGATLGLSSVGIRALGGPEAAATVKAMNTVNPKARVAGNVLGMTGAALLTGGESAVGELGEGAVAKGAGELAAEAAPRALGATETASAGRGVLRQGLDVLGSPTRALGAVGEAVERGVGKLMPWEAHSLAGKLTQAAIKTGARGAAEGGLMGAGDWVSEEALDPNPELSGQRLLASVGHGALLGGLGGGALGVGGELGRDVLGRIAPHVADMAGEQAFRALNARGKATELAEAIPGGVKALGKELIDSGAVQAGNNIEQIAEKLPALREAAGQAVDDFGVKADAAGHAGPKLRNVLDTVRKEVMPRLEALPSFNQGAIERVNGFLDDLAKAAAPGFSDAQKEAFHEATALGLRPNEALRVPALADASTSFQQARDLRARLDDAIRYTKPSLGAPANEVNDALKGARTAFESEIENALDRAAPKMTAEPGLLDQYKSAKLKYRRLALADEIAERSVNARIQNRAFSPTDYLAGGVGAVAGAISGHGLLGLATSVGHRVVRERGNATAAVLMDKIGSLAGVRNALARAEREEGRAVARALGNESRAEPTLKTHGFGTYKEKRDAVMEAATNAEQHAQTVQAATGSFAQHSPKVAQAFHLAALKTTMYLASQLPKPPDPTLEKMTPRLADYEPPSSVKAKFARQFNAAHDPISVLHGCATGSVTLDEVHTLENCHPAWLEDQRAKLREGMLELEKPLPLERAIAISKFLGEPVTPIMRPDFIAARQAAYQSRPQPQTAPKPNSASKATPKADKLSFAKASTLSIGGSRENA